MKTVVITGSTRGFGFGLAQAFLERGCRVSISGRSQSSVDEAAAKLEKAFRVDRLLRHVCDVRDKGQIQDLWDAVLRDTGHIDIWINNAGIAHPLMTIQEIRAEQVFSVIQTNLTGAVYGSQVALQGMLVQGAGAIYNVSGHGGTGRQQQGLSIYGTSKAGLHYFTQSLILETKDSPVIVGELRPGMIVTDLLTQQFEYRPEAWEDAKRIFNILADRVETVAPWMVEQILKNRKHGASINWYGRGKLMFRFLSAPFRRRQVID